jgi:hypothetical protein
VHIRPKISHKAESEYQALETVFQEVLSEDLQRNASRSPDHHAQSVELLQGESPGLSWSSGNEAKLHRLPNIPSHKLVSGEILS